MFTDEMKSEDENNSNNNEKVDTLTTRVSE